jgi:hypothetical protein
MLLSYSSNAGPLMTFAAIICRWCFCFPTPYFVQLIRAARKNLPFALQRDFAVAFALQQNSTLWTY